jgi:hypothetical protein
MSPSPRNGKICYLEIPAVDIQRSGGIPQQGFGWPLGQRGDGSTAFDDTTGEVSGTWVVGRSVRTLRSSERRQTLRATKISSPGYVDP